MPLAVGSTYMLDLLERSGIDRTRISKIHPALAQPDPPAPVNDEAAPTLLFAGRLIPEKGLEHLLRALALVEEPWRLLVCGMGSGMAQCQELANRPPLLGRVSFAGWLSDADLSARYLRCSFVVAPSVWPEPFGRIGPEAAAHGRATVAYDTGGVREWLAHEETGLLVPPGDVQALARALTLLLRRRELTKQMGMQAHERAKMRWNPAEHVRALEDLFLIAQESGPCRGEPERPRLRHPERGRRTSNEDSLP
jgi:glycosyltransferase involved in cell wall biosynthesis